MKDFREAISGCVVFVGVVVVFVALVIGLAALNGALYPWWLSVQRNAVEQSKSFVDANNNMLETYKLEYVRLDTKIAEAQGDEKLIAAYHSQQAAIINQMCTEISTMNRSTVNPNTIAWISSQGGCE